MKKFLVLFVLAIATPSWAEMYQLKPGQESADLDSVQVEVVETKAVDTVSIADLTAQRDRALAESDRQKALAEELRLKINAIKEVAKTAKLKAK